MARRALDATVYIRGGSDVYGAGILLDDQGHILTCRHVVDGLEGIRVFFADGSEHTAKVLDSDARLDAALLQLDFPRPSRVQVAGIASVELGDALLAMGAPRKMAFSLGRGMATYVGRSFDGVHYLQTDLALNGGSSGGPVLDRFGRVVAMSSFVLKDTEGLAFALPVDYALERFAMWLDSASATTLKLDAKAFARWQADVQARGIRKHVAAGSSGLATADETVSP